MIQLVYHTWSVFTFSLSHGGAGRRHSSMAVASLPALPPGASLEGVGQGRCERVLFNLADRPRKKLITNLNDLLYFLPLIQRPTPPKQWTCASPTPPARRTFPPYYPPSQPPVFGRLLRLKSSTGGHLRPWCIFYYIFYVDQFAAPNDGTVSPHALPAQRASTLTPPLPLPPTIGLIVD